MFLTSWSSISQNSDKREKIKALKVAFITERLDLSGTEAQKFWPIYNAYETEKDMQRKLAHEKRKRISEDISEAEAKALLKDMLAYEQEKENLRADFVESLLKVMPAKKIILLKVAEDEFNRKMLQEYKKRRGDGHKEERP